MMLNNRKFRSLGLGPLTSFLNVTRSKRTFPDREDSGSQYEPEDEEDIEEGVVHKVYVMIRDDYSFVLIMQNYLFCSNFFYHAGDHDGFGA